MNVDEYVRYDGMALAGLIRDKQVSPAELLDAALTQVERHNPDLNALTAMFEDIARESISRGLPDGPFRGVPYLLKDLYQQMAGTVTTASCRVLVDRAERDTTLVARLRAAGLVIFGKTNTPELGLSVTTEPTLYGPTRNPWDLTKTPGGSSGGSAAAVAAGIVPMAQASDSGGSTRIPASCCGLVGLKPTRGRNPLGPDLFESQAGATTTHAVTRSVRDAAALLDATSGPELGDAYVCHPHAGTFLAEVAREPGPLRIAVMAEPYLEVAVHPDVRAALDSTGHLLTSLGHCLGTARPALDGVALTDSLRPVFAAHTATTLDGVAARRGRPLSEDELEPLTWDMVLRGRAVKATTYVAATQSYQRATRIAAAFHEQWDVLLSPTLAFPPVPLGQLVAPSADLVDRTWKRFFGFSPFTVIANLTGLPAISLPLGRSADGLPIGMMFTAGLGREGVLLRLAAQLEHARPWSQLATPVM